MARQKKWVGGYVDRESGYFYVKRYVGGVQIHFSTRCKTLEGARAALSEWESDPAHFVPGRAISQVEAKSWQTAVTEFLDYSEHVKGNTADHVKSQAGSFDVISLYASTHGNIDPMGLTPGAMDSFVAWRRQGEAGGGEVGPHTVYADVSAIKAFFSWASRPKDQGGFLDHSPLEKYRAPRRPTGSAKIKVFDMEWWATVKSELCERDRMIGDVLLGSSMRWSSLHRLQRDDVDIDAGIIRLRGNAIKGKDGATVYVSTEVARAAATLTMMHVPSWSRGMNKDLSKACKRLGLPYFSVHCFRHSSASMAIEDGVRGKDLQQRLAHATFATTERYLHRLGGTKGVYRGRI